MTQTVLTSQITEASKASTETSFAAEAAPDVVGLLDKSMVVLGREVTNLMHESARGKLDAKSAQALVQYLRLLNELKAEQQKELQNLTDEELKALGSTESL